MKDAKTLYLQSPAIKFEPSSAPQREKASRMSRREHEFLVNTSLFHEKTYDGIVLFTFNESLWVHPVTVSYISLAGKQNYFTSCDPHHDIYTFSYWQIFWHSI